jgi:2-polyprenyl-3-methyl-5-hydroxy-6-metoxy-1,4-benzoquinol methylase
MSRYARELDLRELNAHTHGILLTPPGSDVLDVGTADGHPVVQGLKERGCRVWGVEIDPEAAAMAAPMCEQMVVGNVEQLDLAEAFGERRFDVVLCLDVLEHLVEPLPVLRRLASLLTPTGILVASIPNVTHAAVRLQLLDGKFSYTDTGLLDRTHVRFFDRDEVGKLFADAGTTVIERLEVRREPHETEIPVDLSAVPEETLAAIKADPDARVFQWIIVARPGVEIEGEATGLTTALLAQTGQLEKAVRESADHIAWLEGHLAAKTEHEQELEHQATTLSNRILELDATLRERVGELLVLDEQVKALRADQTVKEAYVAHLQQSLGIEAAPAPTTAPAQAWQSAAPVHALVDRAATRLQRSPRTYRVLKAAARRVRRR